MTPRGGHAGNGAHVVVKAVDSRLFMLVEVDCRAGFPGKGGDLGTGGHGGRGGSGGSGGRGGYGGTLICE